MKKELDEYEKAWEKYEKAWRRYERGQIGLIVFLIAYMVFHYLMFLR